jgi:type I restriction enzyme M protein
MNSQQMSAEATKLTSFIFGIANHLRNTYRRPQYRRVMLPMTVLRRLDWIQMPINEVWKDRRKFAEITR